MEQGLAPLTDSASTTTTNNNTNTENHPSTTLSISTTESIPESQTTDETNPSAVLVLPSDDMMDLLRAIEMSRLQGLRENEQNIYRPNHSANSATSIPNDKKDYFNELQQAIELSLQTKNKPKSENELTSEFFFILEQKFSTIVRF